jgi:hypothetical protein
LLKERTEMKKRVWMGVAVMVVLLALGAAGFANAQEPQPTEPVPFGEGYGRGGMMGRWNQGAGGQHGPMHEYMIAAMAEALGMSAEELIAELAAGKTMWQVGEAKGLGLEEFQKLMIDARTAALEKLVADGVITQAQADWMLSRMQGMAGRGGMQGGCPMRGGGGRWGAPPAQPNPAASSGG